MSGIHGEKWALPFDRTSVSRKRTKKVFSRPSHDTTFYAFCCLFCVAMCLMYLVARRFQKVETFEHVSCQDLPLSSLINLSVFINALKSHLYQQLPCSSCDVRVPSLCLDRLSEPCRRLLHKSNLQFASNIPRGRIKNSLVVMQLLSPQKVKAGGRSQTTTEDLSEPFGSRLSKLLGYVNIVNCNRNGQAYERSVPLQSCIQHFLG